MEQKKKYEELKFEIVFFTEDVVIASNYNGDGINHFDFKALFGLDDEEDEVVY